MFKRPSSRRKSHATGIELNLVPILDTMVTLIGFLLFTTSFLVLVSIESPIPLASPTEIQEQLKEKPLQLTLTVRKNDIELWSPFSRIPPKAIANDSKGEFDLKAIHEALLEIKKQFPQETSIVLVPRVNTLYDHLIGLMDALRSIEATDPPLYAKNETTGVDEPIKTLFPKIVFGNLMTDEDDS